MDSNNPIGCDRHRHSLDKRMEQTMLDREGMWTIKGFILGLLQFKCVESLAAQCLSFQLEGDLLEIFPSKQRGGDWGWGPVCSWQQTERNNVLLYRKKKRSQWLREWDQQRMNWIVVLLFFIFSHCKHTGGEQWKEKDVEVRHNVAANEIINSRLLICDNVRHRKFIRRIRQCEQYCDFHSMETGICSPLLFASLWLLAPRLAKDW